MSPAYRLLDKSTSTRALLWCARGHARAGVPEACAAARGCETGRVVPSWPVARTGDVVSGRVVRGLAGVLAGVRRVPCAWCALFFVLL